MTVPGQTTCPGCGEEHVCVWEIGNRWYCIPCGGRFQMRECCECKRMFLTDKQLATVMCDDCIEMDEIDAENRMDDMRRKSL